MIPKCPTLRAVLKEECMAWQEGSPKETWVKAAKLLNSLYLSVDAKERAIDAMEKELGYV